MDNFNDDPNVFELQYVNRRNENDNEDYMFNPNDSYRSDILIHDFLVNNVKGKINYNANQFFIRASYGYANISGNFAVNYIVNIFGWNKTNMKELEPFSEVFKTKNDVFMNLIYNLEKMWLKSYVQLPHSSSYIPGCDATKFDDDAFMNFAPDMMKYNLPGGSYMSRFNNDTSHIILTIALDSIVNYKSIYLTVRIFDFMAYASQSISNLIHEYENTIIKSRKMFKERIIKAANDFSANDILICSSQSLMKCLLCH